MRKTVFLLIISLPTLTGCFLDFESGIPKTGEPFARGQNMKYYYGDESSSDLLNLDNMGFSPVIFEYSNDSIWNHGCDIRFNEELGKFYSSFNIWGREGYVNHQFFMRLSENDVDTIDVKFRYSRNGYGGDGIYSNIHRLYYNNILIRCGENTSSEFIPENIFIYKNNGKTSISFDK